MEWHRYRTNGTDILEGALLPSSIYSPCLCCLPRPSSLFRLPSPQPPHKHAHPSTSQLEYPELLLPPRRVQAAVCASSPVSRPPNTRAAWLITRGWLWPIDGSFLHSKELLLVEVLLMAVITALIYYKASAPPPAVPLEKESSYT